MENNYFILHGANINDFECWYPWLKDELAKQSKECFTPQFPSCSFLGYDAWKKVLDRRFKKEHISPKTIFIAHDIAAPFIIKYILDHKIHVYGLILISGFNWYKSLKQKYYEKNESFFTDHDKIGEINNYVSFTYCIYAEDDDYISILGLNQFAKSIKAEINVLKCGGHLNTYKSKKVAEILEVIKQIDNGNDFSEGNDMPIGINAIVTNNNGDILLGRRINRYGEGTYGLVGGKLKQGETIEACTIRELHEEAGLFVEEQDVQVVNFATTITTKHMIQVGVLVKKYLYSPSNMEPHKCDDLRFFPVNNLPKLFIGSKPIIELYLSRKTYDKRFNVNEPK